MALTHLDNTNFDDFIKSAEKPVLVDFYGDGCAPCTRLSPVLEELQEENADIIVVKVNVGTTPEIAMRYSIMSVPTLIVFKDGEIHNKTVGAVGKDVLLELFN